MTKRNLEDQENQVKLVQTVKEFIDQNINSEIDTNKLAEAVGQSKFAINRAFKKEGDDTPIRWMWKRRANLTLTEVVEERRKGNEVKLGEVMSKYGFNSPQHFSRLVKELYGTSPTHHINTQILNLPVYEQENDERTDLEGTGRSEDSAVQSLVTDGNPS